jgi:hypothetical protein
VAEEAYVWGPHQPRIGETLALRQQGHNHARSTSRGAPSIACISAERTRTTSGASPPASSRSPARASSPRSAGRLPPLTDTTPTTAPGTLPGRARATGRPSTVAEGLRDLLWAAGSGRPRPPLDGEPQRTPGLEVKPSNISLTPRSRPDLTFRPCRPASAPATPPITRRSHDDPRHRPTSIISRRGAAASLRRHLHGSVRSPRAPQARRSTRTSTASRWRLRRSCTCAAARCSPDPGERPAAGARADGGPRGGWRTGLVDPRAGRPRSEYDYLSEPWLTRAFCGPAPTPRRSTPSSGSPSRPPSTTPRSAPA